jgi:hypothetical protein
MINNKNTNDVKLIQEIAYQTWPDVRGNSLPAGLYVETFILKRYYR